MNRIRTQIIHPALAPYRIDLFNRLAEQIDVELFFQRPMVSYHKDLDQKRLRGLLNCPNSLLPRNWIVFDRDVPAGLWSFLASSPAEVVVTMEFSMVSIITTMFRHRRKTSFGHVIWSDENLNTLVSHNRLRHALRRFCATRADALVMCYKSVADAFAVRYGLNRDRIFECAVHQDPRSIRSKLRESRSASLDRIRADDLQDRKIVLFVGRLAPVKNLDMAMRAFAKAFGGDRSVVFVLVGSGPERDKLELVCRELKISPQVRFVGHTEGVDLFAWYRCASTLLLPSTYEPYGAVVNEALVCGIPVVCSDKAGASVLINDGRNGFLFSPQDEDGLVDRLRRMSPQFAPAENIASIERDDLMPVPFEKDLNGFIAAIESARRARTAHKSSRGAPARTPKKTDRD